MGPRRVGKTVLLHHVISALIQGENQDPKKIGFFSVDHPLYNGLSLEEYLALFSEQTGIDYRTGGCYFFFDEIQYLRDWEKQLKILVDQLPGARIVVSGSAAAALKLKSDESGAGRFTDFLLPPLTFHEFLYLLNQSDQITIGQETDGFSYHVHDIKKMNGYFIDYLNFGGYPEALFSRMIQKDPGRFIKSDIIDKVLLRDLPGLYGIHDIQELNYLFTTLAFNTANEISLEGLSQNSGVAKNTIKKYIEYLEAAFLIRSVHRVDRNAKRFIRANFFKVYLTNPSIRSALFSPLSSDDQAIGSVVETAIFSQWFHYRLPLHYARWNSGEVDIVGLDNNQKVKWLLEVKWSDKYFDVIGGLKNVIDLCHTHNIKKAMVTTIAKTGVREMQNVRVHFLPASVYAYITGYNAVKGIQPPEFFGEVIIGKRID
ncbi:MAG: ATP-binding protein [Chitinispirillaceae bacterium]|nr:ATP-binding protein [Chitinispirillaceae bacterium]